MIRKLIGLIVFLFTAIAGAMLTIGEDTYLESDGRSVTVDLLYTVNAKAVAYVDGWLGISVQSGDSGEAIALSVDQREYQFTIPPSLDPAKGAIVYIDTANMDGTYQHTPARDTNGYTLTPSATTIALCKTTTAVWDDPDGTNDAVKGILLSQLNVIGGTYSGEA